MLEKRTATLLVQLERSLFPKSFLPPEIGQLKNLYRLTYGPKIVLSRKKKDIFEIFLLNISSLVFSTD